METPPPGNKPILNPDSRAGRCRRCGCGELHRSNSRGWFEQVLFVLGASLARCPRCSARQASIGHAILPLHSKEYELELGFRLMPYAFAAGFLGCLAIAVWTLRRFHRWPF